MHKEGGNGNEKAIQKGNRMPAWGVHDTDGKCRHVQCSDGGRHEHDSTDKNRLDYFRWR